MTNPKSFLEADSQARISALDVSRSFIVQAPAGSGKTELLIQRYLALLSTVNNPEEIIAITFTKKAAAEIQLRVLKALQANRIKDKPSELHELKTYELAGSVLNKSSALNWNLIENPKRMRIQTLDSLNVSISSISPLTSSKDFSNIVTGAELKKIYKSAALSTLDWLSEKGVFQIATSNILMHVDNNTQLYTRYLIQMLETRDQWLPFIGAGLLSSEESLTIRKTLERNLKEVCVDHLNETKKQLSLNNYSGLIELLSFAGTNMLGLKDNENLISNLSSITKLPPPETQYISIWRGIANILLTQNGIFRKTVDKRHGFPKDNKKKKEEMREMLDKMASNKLLENLLYRVSSLPPTQYTNDQWQILLALFRLLPLAVSELNRLFHEQSVTDYIDIAINSAKVLGDVESPSDIALFLDYQIKHLLIDEMQDTSISQCKILEKITAGWEKGDGRTLFFVGDPMQSIYRFRNAEVGQFLLIQKYGFADIELNTILLRQNFRSGANLVNWFNKVFPNTFSSKDDPMKGAISYEKSVPLEKYAGKGECRIHAIFGAKKNAEAEKGCNLIEKILNENPDDQVAVLVRGRTQLPHLLAKLRLANIPYKAIEIDKLTDLPEIIDLLSLTRAAVHQGDRLSWLSLLRAPWVGLNWCDLHALVLNENKKTVWELLQDKNRLKSLSSEGQESIARVMKCLKLLVLPRRTQSLRDLIERVWFLIGGPGTLPDKSAIENIYRYFDILSSQEYAGTLYDIGELESILDLERVSSDEASRLQIMTMHRAKGLQFDHVLLYGLGRQSGKDKKQVLAWLDIPSHDGVEKKIISPVSSRVEINNDPIHNFIEITKNEKAHNEQARLLYVACTRAKKSLHIMGNTLINKNKDEVKPARTDSLLNLLWPSVKDDFKAQYKNIQFNDEWDEQVKWTTPMLKRFKSPWKLKNIQPLSEIDKLKKETDIEKGNKYYWVGDNARIAGILIHRWLQIIVEKKYFSDELLKDKKIYSLTKRWLNELNIKDSNAKIITSRVLSALRLMVNDKKGQWILNGKGYTELSLSGSIDGKIESIIIDRIRIDNEDNHWIIDYKTSSHEGSDLCGFIQAECKRYLPQLKRYASIYSNWSGKTVKCGLYFPLLGEFIEIDVKGFPLT